MVLRRLSPQKIVKMSLTRTPPPPKWAVNSPVTKARNASSIPDPPGYTSKATSAKKSQVSTRKPPTEVETNTLKLKKAWEIALGPGKQIPMQAIMGYMSGNSLQIFSIMMVFMLFKNPIQGIAQTNTSFARFESAGTRAQLLGIKAVYIIMQCAMLALGVYKVHMMGLLPTTRSDWLAWETERQPLERAYFAFD